MYPEYTGSILEWLYPDAIVFADYLVEQTAAGYSIVVWNTAKLGPQPSPEEIAWQELPWRKWGLKAQARNWLTAINGRAYEHAGNSEDFDDVIVAIRTACRAMINNFAAEITPAIAARVSAVEAKAAFSGAAAQFDLIDKAKAGKTLMAAEINALPDIAAVNSYQVTDATAAALWAAANPAVTPTLGELLAQFPVRV